MSLDVTVNVAAKNFYYAYKLGLTDSLHNIANFISKNKTEVKATEGWKIFVAQNIELIEKLFDLC